MEFLTGEKCSGNNSTQGVGEKVDPSRGILYFAAQFSVDGFSQLLYRLTAGPVLDVDHVESG